MAENLHRVFVVSGRVLQIDFIKKFLFTRKFGAIALYSETVDDALRYIPGQVKQNRITLAFVGENANLKEPMQPVVDALTRHFPNLPVFGLGAFALKGVTEHFPLNVTAESFAEAVKSYLGKLI